MPATLPFSLFPEGTVAFLAPEPTHLCPTCPLPGWLVTPPDLEASAHVALPVRCFLRSTQSGLHTHPRSPVRSFPSSHLLHFVIKLIYLYPLFFTVGSPFYLPPSFT